MRVQNNFMGDNEVGDIVDVRHNIEDDLDYACPADSLPTLEQKIEWQKQPSYSVNGKTSYYVTSGVVTKKFKNENLIVKTI